MHRDSQLIAEAYYGNIIREDLRSASITNDIAMKTLMTQVFSDPDKFWELLKKTPGMYGALLTGNVKKLQEIFLSLGVDVNKISDTVQKSMELFAQYERGTPVEVRRATAATPLRATPVRR